MISIVYLQVNNIEATRDASGLYYHIITEGVGSKVPATSTIEVFFKGYLLEGTIFDQTKGEVYSSSLSGLIKGWQIGIPKISKHGKIQLFVPSALGYGSSAKGSIPANSVLIFDLEVYDFK